MQDANYIFFETSRSEFAEKHYGEFVVIKDEKVLGFFETEKEALTETLKENPLGTFIVQKCVPKDQDIHKYHSRVSFA